MYFLQYLYYCFFLMKHYFCNERKKNIAQLCFILYLLFMLFALIVF